MNILKNIFSVTNKEGKDNKIYKVITILCVKFKFQNKYKTALKLIEAQKEEFIKTKKNRCIRIENEIIKMVEKITPHPYLKYVVVDISHHCNLNCCGCDHFSPLAEPKFYDLEQFRNDIKRLSILTNKFMDEIWIMGGEPLLNPQILEFFKISREYLPNTKILCLTNGILITKQSEEFWTEVKRLDVNIEYTKYDIRLDYEKIDSIMKKYDISVKAYADTQEVLKTSYHIPLDINGQQDCKMNFLKCFHANNCITLKNGKLYTCTVAPNIEHFNKYFGKDLPLTDYDGIDIYKANNIQEVLQFLAKPIPFCRFCNVKGRTFGHKWGISKKDISEWT